MNKTSTKITFANCIASWNAHSHSEPWTCRSCGAVACGRCAKYLWKSLGVYAPNAKSTCFKTLPEERVGTCGKCSLAANTMTRPLGAGK